MTSSENTTPIQRHDCRENLEPRESDYPPHVNATRFDCNICGRKYYDAIKPSKVDKFLEICPALYQDTVPHRLPSPSKLDMVQKWEYSPRGLLLYGPTGMGKSRCAWIVAKRLMKAGKTLRALDSSIAFEYAEKFLKNAAAASIWIQRHVDCDVLLCDDVFKSRLTDSLEQAIYTIIATRTDQKRPCIITTNDVGDSLAARMSPDRGPALIRRLREFCEPISFGAKP